MNLVVLEPDIYECKLRQPVLEMHKSRFRG